MAIWFNKNDNNNNRKESIWNDLRIKNVEIKLGFAGTSGTEQMRQTRN